jgi:hypothetical protein
VLGGPPPLPHPHCLLVHSSPGVGAHLPACRPTRHCGRSSRGSGQRIAARARPRQQRRRSGRPARRPLRGEGARNHGPPPCSQANTQRKLCSDCRRQAHQCLYARPGHEGRPRLVEGNVAIGPDATLLQQTTKAHTRESGGHDNDARVGKRPRDAAAIRGGVFLRAAGGDRDEGRGRELRFTTTNQEQLNATQCLDLLLVL